MNATFVPMLSSAETLCPTQASGASRTSMRIRPDGSRHSGSEPSGSSRRSIWSLVHLTVATVAMPSRW